MTTTGTAPRPTTPKDGLLVLGIETSCDETAAAVVARGAQGQGRILSNVVRSQFDMHSIYGGVVPEIAARAHGDCLDHIVTAAMAEAGVTYWDLDGIAAVSGPGLIGGLIVGAVSGKALALAAGKPFLAINHLEAHALTAGLTDGLKSPYLMLLVSGGHTQLLLVEGVGRYKRLGTTIDDALGEAFDKTAKLLGLPMPGGPNVERQARMGNPRRFRLPRPMLGRPEPHFSFAGLKTAVRHAARDAAPLGAQDVADLCASFEAAVTDAVCDRVAVAMAMVSDVLPRGPQRALVVAGGVAANAALRAALQALCDEHGFRLLAPPLELCTDNGAMIAWAGAERLALGLTDGLDAAVRPRWPLDPAAPAAIGAGVKA
ncbi:MAG TPA: tRNA (adenosine(37)-N6)-threonylcarbamoyltransferase complex transferase subunit TsaD [Hyphomicrobium sp.]|nr:tRNA (adenosine(37)-N6)-threonylcarbamoyltransferase complex transferase subunit TsaD [Hyphomicrobium sp.]